MPRVIAALSCLILLIGAMTLPVRGDALPTTKARLLEDIKFLASDDLEGRGVGTNGLNLAAEFVKKEFANAGLAVNRVDGDAFQKFDIVTGSKPLGPLGDNLQYLLMIIDFM